MQDRESFTKTFSSDCLPHRPELLAYATRLTRSQQAASDVVQDAYLRAMGSWHLFDPGDAERAGAVRAWLYRIVTNTFIQAYRRAVRRARLVGEHRDDVLRTTLGVGADEEPERGWDPDADLDAARASLSDDVGDALDILAPVFRDVVERADFLGQSYREIAAALGIPVGTVMSRLHRARQLLSEMLAPYARREYGIGPGAARSTRRRAVEHAPAAQAAEQVQPQPHGVDGVVARDDAPELLG